MIIDCISDLHGHYPKLEGGDLLIVAGDFDPPTEHALCHSFITWLANQSYKKKVFIAGNHDNRAVLHPWNAFDYEYLCDSGTEFEYYVDDEKPKGNGPTFDVHYVVQKKLKIWGSPWTKSFEGMNPHCKAFTVDTDEELAKKWALIPNDIDILITHSPSFGNYDCVKDYSSGHILSVESVSLWMKMLCMVDNLRLHVTGHVHEGYGHSEHANGIHLVNASHVNENYKPVNPPIRIIL